MSFTTEQLKSRLSTLASSEPSKRFVVAFSGGLDSAVLLHALRQIQEGLAIPMVAVHVQHDLHADAGEWESHCKKVASVLNVDYMSIAVEVDRKSGQGLEASARTARYQALKQIMKPGDWLLSAHHQDDQAETLLLNLLRGSGMAGLAGIGAIQEFGPAHLVRPLLDVPREDLQAYANSHDLTWLDDPSNADTQFDRNYLRHSIIPMLKERWPAASAKLARSAALASEASALLDHLADDDLRTLGQPQRIEIAALAALPDDRQRNVLRRALKLSGLSSAPTTALRQIIDELIPAKPDAEPLVRWTGSEVRRYRDFLYLLPELPQEPTSGDYKLSADANEADLAGLGHLSLHNSGTNGIKDSVIETGLEIRFRVGGEEIRPTGHDCTHKLKKLLQQKGIVPWMRDRIPLLYAGDRLVAVADLWVASDEADNNGQSVSWKEHPALY
jgi:tRNA(Ile)-lysidine synthase